jgi:hypothetical protein
MKDHALPLTRMLRWKWLGGLGYIASPVNVVTVVLALELCGLESSVFIEMF